MHNIIGIMREGLSKPGEKRVTITPKYAKQIIEWGHKLIVQSAVNPKNGEVKRIFPDISYKRYGAEISEDLSSADIIFGLKEIHSTRILPHKVYYLFSHTHKGQLKNRKLLKTFVDNHCTVVDYEFICDDDKNRLITAFTYNAGYAGMVDTLWTLGKRLKIKGIHNPFESITQSIEEEQLKKARRKLEHVAARIKSKGTPKKMPPIIVCFLGTGKTANGAREMFDIMPHEDITIDQLKEVYESGSRNKLYVFNIGRKDIYKLNKSATITDEEFASFNSTEVRNYYAQNPKFIETNLDVILPYVTVVMNCITWSPEYPRTITSALMKKIYGKHKTLKVIGDITCDPNGSIEFSKETWINNPVFMYNPTNGKIKEGFEGEGIAVMAVTNLPCEFSADASEQFGGDLYPFLKNIITANYKRPLSKSKLAPEIKRAVIMWKGRFTKEYDYMQKFVAE
jgi:alpha-aminoadipic semialdehyde synthase